MQQTIYNVQRFHHTLRLASYWLLGDIPHGKLLIGFGLFIPLLLFHSWCGCLLLLMVHTPRHGLLNAARFSWLPFSNHTWFMRFVLGKRSVVWHNVGGFTTSSSTCSPSPAQDLPSLHLLRFQREDPCGSKIPNSTHSAQQNIHLYACATTGNNHQHTVRFLQTDIVFNSHDWNDLQYCSCLVNPKDKALVIEAAPHQP